MSDSQKRTIANYANFRQVTAIASVLKHAVGSELVSQLRKGPQSVDELRKLDLYEPRVLGPVLKLLVQLGFLEQYGDDIALSHAAQLISGKDSDLGNDLFSRLNGASGTKPPAQNQRGYRQRIAGRQWTHTAAAMQAAELLGIGPSEDGGQLLELGSGAGVWSAAMSYRDPKLNVTAVDQGEFLDVCRTTYKSINAIDRLTCIEDDYLRWDTPLQQYDLVVLPEVVQLEADADAVVLLGRAADTLRVGGHVAVIETVASDQADPVTLACQALELSLGSSGGKQRTPGELQQLMMGAGFKNVRWANLSASEMGLALFVADRGEL